MTNLTCASNRSHVKANYGSVIFASLDIFEDQSTVIKRNLNICLAIDCSGSMQGEKIQQAKESALILARSLSPSDTISIVKFEGKVKVELAATTAVEQQKIEKVIRSLEVGSATQLYNGLKKADDVVSNKSQSGAVSRIVLITDGIPTDNENPNDYEKLCKDIRKRGITVSPIGIGDNYNEGLLTLISDSGGGEWLHVTDPRNQLTNFLTGQIIDMQNTVAINPQLRFEMIPGAEIINLYSVKPVLTELELPQRQGNQYIFNIRDIIAGQEQTIAFRVRLPPHPSGNYNLLHANIMNKTIDVPITYTDDPTLYNVETDPNPRLLLQATEGTVMLVKGIEGDTIALNQATKIMKNIPDPEATIMLDPTTQDTILKLKGMHDKTTMKPQFSEAEKKDLVSEGRTIIRRKKE